MKKIVISNQKGGIGKTTTSVSLAYILARDENHVLLIDTDRQGNTTDTMEGKIEDTGTLYDVLIDDPNIPLNMLIQHTPYENLDLIASDPLLSKADEALRPDVDGIFKLNDFMERIEGMYDYVIMDTAPNIDSVFHNAMIAADELIIPVLTDRYSVQGLSVLMEQVAVVKKRANPKLHIAGLLLTNTNPRTSVARDVKEALTALATDMNTILFKSEIHSSTKVKEAQIRRVPLPVYAPSCLAALDYDSLVDELKERGII